MNFSTPENSTISSNLRVISRRFMPRIGAVQVDVLAAGELAVEAGPDLEQAADPAADLGAPLGRRRDPREDLEQRRLAGAVLPDDADAPRPRSTEKETSWSAQISSCWRRGSRRWTRRLPPWRWRRGACRSLAGAGRAGSASRDLSTTIAQSSDRVREARLGAPEEGEPEQEDDAAPMATLTAACPTTGAGEPSSAQRKPVTTAFIGLREKIHCQRVGRLLIG